MKVALVALLLLLVGCGGGDPDDPAPSDSASTDSSSSASSTPPATAPSEPSEPTEGGPVDAFTFQIRISDARPDAQDLVKCVGADPADPGCAAWIEELSLSAQALAIQLERLGTPPAEVADLATRTLAAATAAMTAADTYAAACPEAGATSSQCATDLVALADGPGQTLIDTVKEWKPLL